MVLKVPERVERVHGNQQRKETAPGNVSLLSSQQCSCYMLMEPPSGQTRKCIKCLLRMADVKNPDSRYEIPISKDILSGIQCCSQSKDFKSIQPKTCVAENFSYLFLLQYGKRGLKQLFSMLNAEFCKLLQKKSDIKSKNEFKSHV